MIGHPTIHRFQVAIAPSPNEASPISKSRYQGEVDVLMYDGSSELFAIRPELETCALLEATRDELFGGIFHVLFND